MIQFPSLRKNVTGNLTLNNPYLSLPTDFLSTYSLAVVTVNGYEYLLNKDVNFISDFKKYVINLIRQSYDLSSLQQESETTKPAIREVPAYKIRKMIK